MPLLTKHAVIRQLLVYAAAYPEASDTPQGIARWWLKPAEAVDMLVLDAALEFLADQGAFAPVQAPDARVRWRRVGSDTLLHELLAQFPPATGGEPEEA